MRIDEILQRLNNVKKQTKGWAANCPACGDTKKHLSLTQDSPDGTTRILCKCFKGCSFQSIVSSMGLRESDFFDSEEAWVESCGDITPESLESRNEAYIQLLEQLTLSEQHKLHLLGRGFSESEVESFAFRSICHKSAASLHCDKIVPGYDKARGWKRAQGILIPTISPEGQLWALKVKSDSGTPKYFWYSSSGNLGKVFAYHQQGQHKCIRVVEGVLKSCLAHAILARKEQDIATIGIGGVNVWKGVVEYYKGREKQRFIISFDQDNKQATTTEIEKFREALLEEGHEVSVELWNPDDGKGIDDVLHSGRATRIIPWGKNDQRPRGLPGSPAGDFGGLNAKRASDIEPVQIDWIAKNWFPRGYFVHLSGSPSAGKGILTALLAKSLTSKSGSGVGPSCKEPHTVAIINREDDSGSVIIPRLRVAGADLGRCFVVDGAINGEFSIPKNLDKLEYFIRDSGASVIFIDPLPSFLDPGIGYSDDSQARPIAVKIGKMARDLGVCIVGVFHLTKSTSGSGLNRPAGAMSWMGEARKAFLLEFDSDNQDKRFLINTKSNLGRPLGILELGIEEVHGSEEPRMVWLGRSYKSESDILNKDWKKK